MAGIAYSMKQRTLSKHLRKTMELMKQNRQDRKQLHKRTAQHNVRVMARDIPIPLKGYCFFLLINKLESTITKDNKINPPHTNSPFEGAVISPIK